MNTTSTMRLVVAAAAALPVTAQACWNQGSVAVAARLEPAPTTLGCAGAPNWPAWHLLTPAHRAPAPHPGFAPGDARALPRLLVTYRCTGLLLVPVLPTSVATMGYVIDRAEIACADGDREAAKGP